MALELTKLQPRMPVTVVGAAFGDIILNMQQLPLSGGDEVAEETGRQIGGCAFNVARSLKRLGADVINGIPVGNGSWGQAIEKSMEAEQLPVLLRHPTHDNGWCIAVVEPSKERTFVTVEGCEQYIDEQLLQQLPECKSTWVYVSGYELVGKQNTSLRQWLLNLPEQYQIFVDPGPRITDFDDNLINSLLTKKIVLTVNRDELSVLLQQQTAFSAIQRFVDHHNIQLIARLDKEGAWVFAPQANAVEIEPEKIDVCDTVGAGDAHCGGTLMGLSCGLSLAEATALGNRVAAIVVSRPGADGAPFLEELYVN